jgi:serine protease Do
MARYIFTFTLLFKAFFLFADKEAKDIAKNYAAGVVKILLYGEDLVKEFDLSKDEGYLTRGSGFFVTTDGYIFTNKHVVDWCVYGYMVADWVDEENVFHELDILTYENDLEKDSKIKKIYFIGHAQPIIQVFDQNKKNSFKLYKAEVVTMGQSYDGAVLKVVTDIDGNDIKNTFIALPLADASKVVMGEDIIILGFPAQYADSDLNLDLKDSVTMSFGRHSGWDFVFDDEGLIKTDALIHEGNSGGPAFDDTEKVIGIATAMGVKTQIGLVQPINDMYYLVENDPALFKVLKENGLPVPYEKKRIKTVSGEKRILPKVKFASLQKINAF